MFSPLALAYIFAILCSLAVALTVTPALAMLLLGHSHLDPKDPPLVAGAKRGYGRLLAGVHRRPGPVWALVGMIVVAGLASVPLLRTSFLPPVLRNSRSRFTAARSACSLSPPTSAVVPATS